MKKMLILGWQIVVEILKTCRVLVANILKKVGRQWCLQWIKFWFHLQEMKKEKRISFFFLFLKS